MDSRYKDAFRKWHPVHERNGELYCRSVLLPASAATESGVSLPPAVRDALRLTDHARLHRCSECNAPFIAHHAARLCSPECALAVRGRVQKKAREMRSAVRDAFWREQVGKECRNCGKIILATPHISRRFCSDACRIAHRARALRSRASTSRSP